MAGQEAHVFDSSLRENLRLARPDASDEQLLDALRRVRLDDWVASLPDGLDTLVGEEGMQLSGASGSGSWSLGRSSRFENPRTRRS
jgi:ATP-binding cassette subfamily C protein CydCD